MPLLGVVSLHGNEYLYGCIDGEDETLSLWYYADIRPHQRERFEAMSPEEFNQAHLNEEFEGPSALAFATDRLGIVAFATVEESPDRAVVRERTQAALAAMRRRLSELSDDADHLGLLSFT